MDSDGILCFFTKIKKQLTIVNVIANSGDETYLNEIEVGFGGFLVLCVRLNQLFKMKRLKRLLSDGDGVG